MNRDALALLSKDDLVALLLARESRHSAEIAALAARIAELERRLDLNRFTLRTTSFCPRTAWPS